MKIDELKAAALALPYAPGVYIMRDKDNCVIYVGKAKKLKNRVSQYFQESASHSVKTKKMVSKVDHFDVIIASSEFEALVLECSLIKQHLPKYNILLKDGKGYPYIRLNTAEPYPNFKIVTKIENDGAEYFGPFGSKGATEKVLQTIRKTLLLPTCGKKFPNDIGKDRPCLNYHMNVCGGWCQPTTNSSDYKDAINHARLLLNGNYKGVADFFRKQMLAAAEDLNFEFAASCRDKLNAIELLSKKQSVTTIKNADTDVIGYAQIASKACFAVLHFKDGCLINKEYEIIPITDAPDMIVSALLKQYYFSRGFAPKVILLPFAIEDSGLFSKLLKEKFGKTTRIFVPQRGSNLRLVDIAVNNAKDEVERVTTQTERINGALSLLANMLLIDAPKRIEAFDVSHIAGTDIVASMVVFQDGLPRRSEYKRFRISDLDDQDDYASMRQAVKRRFLRYTNHDNGFENFPDLLLIDGGSTHAKIAAEVLDELGLSANVFGMVKDNRHRTRALVTSEGSEIRIDCQQSVFSMIGSIQEETHRFAISYHKKLRGKHLRYSELDKISGIGKKRKELLLKTFKSISAIAAAELIELEQYLPHNAAVAVYDHFRINREGRDS